MSPDDWLVSDQVMGRASAGLSPGGKLDTALLVTCARFDSYGFLDTG